MPSALPLLLAGGAAAALLFANRSERREVLATKTPAKRTVTAQAGEVWSLTAKTNLPARLVPELNRALAMRSDVELVEGPFIVGSTLRYVVRYLKPTTIEIGARIQMGSYWIELVEASPRVGGGIVRPAGA